MKSIAFLAAAASVAVGAVASQQDAVLAERDLILTVIDPCPDCPSSIRPAPITITVQNQPYPTLIPIPCGNGTNFNGTALNGTTLNGTTVNDASFNGTTFNGTTPNNNTAAFCNLTIEYSTEYVIYVSTVLPILFHGSSVTVTDEFQIVTYSSTSTTAVGTLTAPTAGVYTNPASEVVTLAAPTMVPYTQTVPVYYAAPYNSLGPLAIPSFGGSGLCGDACLSPSEARQVANVEFCVGNVCYQYTETVITVVVITTNVVYMPFQTVQYAPTNGVYTISVLPGIEFTIEVNNAPTSVSVATSLPSTASSIASTGATTTSTAPVTQSSSLIGPGLPTAPTPVVIAINPTAAAGAVKRQNGVSGYVGFSGSDAVVVPHKADAAQFLLGNRVLIGDGSLIGATYAGLNTDGYAPLQQGVEIEVATTWNGAIGSPITFTSPLFSFGSESTVFCARSDNTLYGQYTSATPFECITVQFFAESPQNTSSSSSTSSSATSSTSSSASGSMTSSPGSTTGSTTGSSSSPGGSSASGSMTGTSSPSGSMTGTSSPSGSLAPSSNSSFTGFPTGPTSSPSGIITNSLNSSSTGVPTGPSLDSSTIPTSFPTGPSSGSPTIPTSFPTGPSPGSPTTTTAAPTGPSSGSPTTTITTTTTTSLAAGSTLSVPGGASYVVEPNVVFGPVGNFVTTKEKRKRQTTSDPSILFTTPSSSAEDCAATCSGTSGCEVATLYNGLCYGQSSVGSASNLPGAVSLVDTNDQAALSSALAAMSSTTSTPSPTADPSADLDAADPPTTAVPRAIVRRRPVAAVENRGIVRRGGVFKSPLHKKNLKR